MEAYWTIIAILLGATAIVYGAPAIDPAAVAADPVAVASPPAPAVVAERVPVATSPVKPVAGEQLGGGTVTEHKNPDGSTVTITRYNGPLPDSAFKNHFGNFGLGWGLAGMHDSLFQHNLYQNRLIQLQTQQAMNSINQAYLGHYNSLVNNIYNPLIYRTSYISPYTTSYTSIGQAPAFYHPSFFPYGGAYNPFIAAPYGQPATRTA